MKKPFELAEEWSVYQIVWTTLRFAGSDFLLNRTNIMPKPKEPFDIHVGILSGRSLGTFSVHDEMSLGFFLRNRLNIINTSNQPTRAGLVSGEVQYEQVRLRFCSVVGLCVTVLTCSSSCVNN